MPDRAHMVCCDKEYFICRLQGRTYLWDEVCEMIHCDRECLESYDTVSEDIDYMIELGMMEDD